MRSNSTTPIDVRKQTILKVVVNEYVRTAEPVGSQVLAQRHAFGVKSATIRNELAELSELGYLHQPHTSAGRIPSDLGYRFYVDRLMEASTLSARETLAAKRRLTPRSTEIDTIIEQTCRILSNLAHYTSLATHPTVRDANISHISVTGLGKNKALAVVVLDSGSVLHEFMEFSAGSRPLDPVAATNFLTEKLAGRTLQAARDFAPGLLTEDEHRFSDVLNRVQDFIGRTLEQMSESDVHLEGASYIIQQPEFRDAQRLETVLRVLEQRNALYKLFSSVYVGPEVTVIIGSENPLVEMRECSFVGARYRIGNRVAGTLGLLGPTRMDYRRAVGAVEFMSKNLGALLTTLSLS